MYRLVLLRHGESTWNQENRFTGWVDVDLTEKGREEAREAGRLMAAEKFEFDVAYTSVLKRAIRTLVDCARRDGHAVDPGAPILAAERAALRRAAGIEQVRDSRKARRGAGQDLAPQLRHPTATAAEDDPTHPSHDRRYTTSIPDDQIPSRESLKDTVARFIPYWERNDRARHQGRKACADRGARQQPCGRW